MQDVKGALDELAEQVDELAAEVDSSLEGLLEAARRNASAVG